MQVTEYLAHSHACETRPRMSLAHVTTLPASVVSGRRLRRPSLAGGRDVIKVMPREQTPGKTATALEVGIACARASPWHFRFARRGPCRMAQAGSAVGRLTERGRTRMFRYRTPGAGAGAKDNIDVVSKPKTLWNLRWSSDHRPNGMEIAPFLIVTILDSSNASFSTAGQFPSERR